MQSVDVALGRDLALWYRSWSGFEVPVLSGIQIGSIWHLLRAIYSYGFHPTCRQIPIGSPNGLHGALPVRVWVDFVSGSFLIQCARVDVMKPRYCGVGRGFPYDGE